MLSRIAESLFWIGRYIERAEDTARILDVHVHLVLEDRIVDPYSASHELLNIMGIKIDDATNPEVELLEQLGWERNSPTSIAGSIEAAWQNARVARTAISSELWKALNVTHFALNSQILETKGRPPHVFFDWVKERAAILSGLSESTLIHDDGWRFLTLGTTLERIDMTGRLLYSRKQEALSGKNWVTTLRSCSAYEAYLRTYRRGVSASSAIEFLLLNRYFPRSILYSLINAERLLMELDPYQTYTASPDTPRKALGLARSMLEYSNIDDLLTSLPEQLESIQKLSANASIGLAKKYFSPTQIIEWRS